MCLISYKISLSFYLFQKQLRAEKASKRLLGLHNTSVIIEGSRSRKPVKYYDDNHDDFEEDEEDFIYFDQPKKSINKSISKPKRQYHYNGAPLSSSEASSDFDIINNSSLSLSSELKLSSQNEDSNLKKSDSYIFRKNLNQSLPTSQPQYYIEREGDINQEENDIIEIDNDHDHDVDDNDISNNNYLYGDDDNDDDDYNTSNSNYSTHDDSMSEDDFDDH